MTLFKKISIVAVIIFIISIIAYIYTKGQTPENSSIWGWLLYILSLPIAYFANGIKSQRPEKDSPLKPATYEQHVKAREEDIRRLEKRIDQRVEEIDAIKDANEKLKENINNSNLTEKQKWGKKLLSEPLRRSDLRDE